MGLVVAQDGGNTPDVLDEEGEKRDNTNFKFVRWLDVADALGLVSIPAIGCESEAVTHREPWEKARASPLKNH